MYLNQYVARILSCEIALTGSPASTETAFGLCCSEHPTRTAETATRTAEHGIPITLSSRSLELWRFGLLSRRKRMGDFRFQ